MSYKDRIKSAVASLEAHLNPDYTAMTEQYGLKRHTLNKWFQGQTTSKAEPNSKYQQYLTTTSEKVLIDHITKLRC